MSIKYFEELKDTIDKLESNSVEKVSNIIYHAYKSDKQIFIMGNGGSASTASHFACDLGKGTIVDGRKRIKVISLNDNMAVITALANDCGYDMIFVEQIKNFLNDGDIVIAISASGNSPNIIKCVEYAAENNAYVIGFTGFDGGILSCKSDLHIHVDNCNYGQIEDIHLSLEHFISQDIKNRILNE